MAKKSKPLHPDAPLCHPDHPRPVTRRDFIRQGFMTGVGVVMGGGLFSLFANPRQAYATLSTDIQNLATASGCPVNAFTGGKIPFICFDLAGGASIAGSNVLVGQAGGQLDSMTPAGFSKLGVPSGMLPDSSTGNFIDTQLGLAFHTDSGFLRGILEKASATALTVGGINGAVIPARSANDTGNNPHNPMYGIAMAGGNPVGQGAEGSVVTLIGSRPSDSGGNSTYPPVYFNPEIRPTKVDRPSDVTGMVDTGNLTGILSNRDDVVAVMESIVRISDQKLSRGALDTKVTRDAVIKNLVRCGYLSAADIADRFAGISIDPAADPLIVGPTGIFTQTEFNSDGEFRKTASVMKMVIDGYAGAGTITMGGYDYHTGNRSTGEIRDLRAGRCMGACLEYAARRGTPLMLYVYSDGSVFSNGTTDGSTQGRGKGVWTGDNSSTAASFFLVYNPTGAVSFNSDSSLLPANLQQIGYFTGDGSVVNSATPAANNVNLLVQLVLANYMALNNEKLAFGSAFPSNSLGNIDNLIAFDPIV